MRVAPRLGTRGDLHARPRPAQPLALRAGLRHAPAVAFGFARTAFERADTGLAATHGLEEIRAGLVGRAGKLRIFDELFDGACERPIAPAVVDPAGVAADALEFFFDRKREFGTRWLRRLRTEGRLGRGRQQCDLRFGRFGRGGFLALGLLARAALPLLLRD